MKLTLTKIFMLEISIKIKRLYEQLFIFKLQNIPCCHSWTLSRTLS